MFDTKETILATAKQLFNTHGFGNVTIRMIALEMGISPGHLNYHFKRREDLLEALYFEMVAVFDNRVEQLDPAAIDLPAIRRDMLLSMQRMVDYRFFWTDLYNLMRSNEKIKAHFAAAYEKRFRGYQLLFQGLIARGIMRDFEYSEEPSLLARRMIAYGNTWLYNSALYDEEINEQQIARHADILLSTLYAHLTDQGKDQYQEGIPASF